MESLKYRTRTSNGQTDILLDIERVSPEVESNGISDDLHLAALLGKTLLQKNGDLEIQLKRLEEFAEETLASNHTLANQLSGCKDALKLANSSCESLELKLEEIDKENKELKLKLAKKEMMVEVKTKIIDDLQARLEVVEREFAEYKEEMTKKMKANNNSSSSLPDAPTKQMSYDETKTTIETSELKDLVDELSFKLQNATYQKTKAQQNLDRATSENSKLVELVKKNEAEILELQNRIKLLEEGLPSEPATPSASLPPHSPSRHYMSPTHHASGNDFTDVDSIALKQITDHQMMSSPSSLNGLTFFSELQSEFSILQNKFDVLLSNCSCGASAQFKDKPPPGKDLSKKEPSLKDLFQEVYATLKQTTIVADKLIERRKVFQS